MTVVNHSTVGTGLIKYIAETVGDKLSTLKVKKGATPLPAVIQDRVKGPRPDFPYIVVDRITSAKTQNSWLRHEEAIETSPGVYEVNYKSEQTLGFTVTCYGKDADDILNHLRISSVDDYARASLNALTGAVFQNFTNTNENPIFIETDFVDGAVMDCYFTAISNYIPPKSSVIEVVKSTGQYFEETKLVDSKTIYVDENT